MRKTIFIGLLVSTLLISAPAARATDDSVRAVVQAQATRQITEDKKFEKAVRKLSTKAQLKKARTATKKQRASIETFKQALAAERADSARVKQGRREMLDAINLYDRGLNKFHTALTQAINSGGASGRAKSKSALKNMTTAVRRVRSAAKKIA